MGKIYDDTVLDLEYVPSSLADQQSHLSDYFSGEGDLSGDSSLDSIVLQCLFDNMTFDNAEEFEAHQIASHTVNGRFSCGLCDKNYSTKYLRHNHVKGSHLGMKIPCEIQGCNKYFLLKCYRDEHIRKQHGKPAQVVKYVCDICQHTCDSIELLSEHKLKHSDKKKFICHYCRTWGYTKECDCKMHEEKCTARLASLEKVQVPKSSSVKNGSKKDGAKRKLF